MKKTNTKRGPLPGRGPLQTLERGGGGGGVLVGEQTGWGGEKKKE